MDRFGAETAAPAALFERVLGERIDEDTVRWLVDGFRKFDRLEGSLPLERCLQLPTPEQRRRSERDYWIRAAARLLDAHLAPFARATEVADRLSIFMSRGPWRQWRDLSDAPDTATELQRALFHAARAIGDKPSPQWRQVMRLLDVVTETASADNETCLTLSA